MRAGERSAPQYRAYHHTASAHTIGLHWAKRCCILGSAVPLRPTLAGHRSGKPCCQQGLHARLAVNLRLQNLRARPLRHLCRKGAKHRPPCGRCRPIGIRAHRITRSLNGLIYMVCLSSCSTNMKARRGSARLQHVSERAKSHLHLYRLCLSLHRRQRKLMFQSPTMPPPAQCSPSPALLPLRLVSTRQSKTRPSKTRVFSSSTGSMLLL